MSRRVGTTPRAEADLDRIFARLEARSREGAARWYEAFWEAADRLAEYPFAWPPAAEAADLEEDVREMLFSTPRGRVDRALFLATEGVASILCIRGPGERPVRKRDLEP